MKKLVGLILTLFLLAACSGKKEFRLHVVFENVLGLDKGGKVFVNGVSIGEIEEISFVTKYKPVATIRFHQSEKIPIESSFEIGAPSLIEKGILISFNKGAGPYYENEDTVIGVKARNLQESISEALDSIPDSVKIAMSNRTMDLIERGLSVIQEKKEMPAQPDEATSQKAIDLVLALDAVKKEIKMVETLSKGKRHLQFLVLHYNPGKKIYHVLVAEDNGHFLVNHFVFLVDLWNKKVLNPEGEEVESLFPPMNAGDEKILDSLKKTMSIFGKKGVKPHTKN